MRTNPDNAKRRPYRLADRVPLTPATPYMPELVQTMIEAAVRGPKGRRATYSEPNVEAIKTLSATLNYRHAIFYAAQQDRARKEPRDRAVALIGTRQCVTKINTKFND